MTVRTFSFTNIGLQPQLIEVEVDTIFGKPRLVIIGLPEKTLVEAKERITASLTHCGVRIRAQRTVVNLAPADHRKNGSTLELAIAVSLLKLYSLVPQETPDTVFLGELSLDGTLKPIPGCLLLCQAARQHGFTEVCVPTANAAQASLVDGLRVVPIGHLREYLDHFQHSKPWPSIPTRHIEDLLSGTESSITSPDFADIAGQKLAKRALEIAAAGDHHVLLVGPPGNGKTMLAQAMPGILPVLSAAEALEVLTLQSVSTDCTQPELMFTRPFCAPHHSTTRAGLIGGGTPLVPGQVSLAHTGVLFLDEFAEFNRDVIESLRLPMEEGRINLIRGGETLHFPARCIVIAATNPCPCGYYQSSVKACHCSAAIRQRYAAKYSGPILDRFDMRVSVEGGEGDQTLTGEPSSSIRARIERARQRQAQRYQSSTQTNRSLELRDISALRLLKPQTQQFISRALSQLGGSTRAYVRCVRVAQTIADLAGSECIEITHLAEALQFRTPMNKKEL